MRLYPRTDIRQVQDSAGTVYDADENGAFELPAEFGEFLNRQHFDGVHVFETDAERTARINAETLAFRRDPANLLDAVERLGGFDQKVETPAPDDLRKQAEDLLARAEEIEKAQA